MKRHLIEICLLSLLTVSLSLQLFAQNAAGTISGNISDSTGAVVPNAVITITDLATNSVRVTKTGPSGTYTVANLRPSHYKITVIASGFKESQISDIELHTQDTLSENVILSVGSETQTVQVDSDIQQIDTSATLATTISRHFIETMPLNGRSFQALIALAPGNVTAKTYYTNSGQFSIDGLRTDANYFSIDGVSANVGITQGSDVYLGSSGAGAGQATSSSGGYSNLVSIDDMQEYKMQTSSFDAEYGRSPGAQLSIITRSGSNQFHGTAFEYLRNDVFDANSWYNKNEGLPRTAEKQNDFGGVVGGPILRNKLFFFGSYEGFRLRVPQSSVDIVPTTWARNQASAVLLPLLEAYPLPTPLNDVNGNWVGQFFASYSNPSTLNATSLRLDFNPTSKLSMFIRGDIAPSSGSQYGAFNAYTRSTYSTTAANLDTTTAGATYTFTNSLVNDFRYNISHAKGSTTVIPIALGGAIIPSDAYLFQSNPTYNIKTSVFGLYFNDGSTGYYVGNDATNHQRQLNYVDTLSWTHGRHNFKFGVDFRHLTPRNGYRPWDISYDFDSVKALIMTQVPDWAGVDTSEASILRPVFNNWSLFAQDTVQLGRRLTVNYGIRWDYDPPPTETTGHPLYTTQAITDIANVTMAPEGTPLWNASKANFSPRLGIAWTARNSAGYETVLHGGGGIFYGLGSSQGAQGTLAFPYSRSNYLYGAAGTYPLNQADGAGLPLTLNPPYSFVYSFDTNLKDPRVYMWNVSLQQNFGSTRDVKVSYVGNVGKDLLRNEILTPGMGGDPNYTYLDVTTNNDHSNYNALQVEFKQNMWRHLQVQGSFSWSHSLDNGSNVALPLPYHTIYNPSLDYSDSDYDIRYTFNNAITYEIPGKKGGNRGVHYATNGWAVDSLFRSNSASPINITTGQWAYGLVWSTDAVNQRPDRNPNVPIWKSETFDADGRRVPGGKVIDITAFSQPATNFTQGNLGRNALRGFDVWQEDFSLRRDFPIRGDMSLLFRAEAFNVINHPLFGDVGLNDDRSIMTNPYFGESSETLAASLGGGGADGGFSSLYQIGAPRSLQFALKLQF
jgi:hypothetical protein